MPRANTNIYTLNRSSCVRVGKLQVILFLFTNLTSPLAAKPTSLTTKKGKAALKYPAMDLREFHDDDLVQGFKTIDLRETAFRFSSSHTANEDLEHMEIDTLGSPVKQSVGFRDSPYALGEVNHKMKGGNVKRSLRRTWRDNDSTRYPQHTANQTGPLSTHEDFTNREWARPVGNAFTRSRATRVAPRQQKAPSTKIVRMIRKRAARQVTSICNSLIGYDPINVFATNCETTLPDWIVLLHKTRLPTGITSTDSRIITAFQAVDTVINGHGTYLLQRLANMQLKRLFDSLETIIKSDRDNGRIHREPSYRNANIAMDIYLSAQAMHSNQSRTKLKQGRKRFSRRWSQLAASSPLFLLVYSDTAELIM